MIASKASRARRPRLISDRKGAPKHRRDSNSSDGSGGVPASLASFQRTAAVSHWDLKDPHASSTTEPQSKSAPVRRRVGSRTRDIAAGMRKGTSTAPEPPSGALQQAMESVLASGRLASSSGQTAHGADATVGPERPAQRAQTQSSSAASSTTPTYPMSQLSLKSKGKISKSSKRSKESPAKKGAAGKKKAQSASDICTRSFLTSWLVSEDMVLKETLDAVVEESAETPGVPIPWNVVAQRASALLGVEKTSLECSERWLVSKTPLRVGERGPKRKTRG